MLKSITAGYFNNFWNNMAELFQNMFSDSDILEKLELGPNKKKYFTNSGIKLYLKHLLIESVKQ